MPRNINNTNPAVHGVSKPALVPKHNKPVDRRHSIKGSTPCLLTELHHLCWLIDTLTFEEPPMHDLEVPLCLLDTLLDVMILDSASARLEDGLQSSIGLGRHLRLIADVSPVSDGDGDRTVQCLF